MLFSDKMNIPPHLKLFDSCVKPILLYCSESWSLDSLVDNRSILENKYLLFPPVKMQLKFDKYLLGATKGATNMAVLSELGLDPISIDALKLAIGFWYHVINTANKSLVHKAYEENLTLQNGTASKIKQLFCKIGFNHVWENQCSFSKKRLLVLVVTKLRGFINFWKSNLFDDRNSTNGNKLCTYREFKTEL